MPRLDIIGITVAEGEGTPKPEGRRVTIIVGTTGSAPEPAAALRRLTTRITKLPRGPALSTEAVGLAHTTESYLYAGAELSPGRFVITFPDAPGREWILEIPGGPDPVLMSCEHGGAAPTFFQTRHVSDAQGRPFVGDQLILLQPCCREKFEHWRSQAAHQYVLAVYLAPDGPVRLLANEASWTLRPGDYLIGNPLDQVGPDIRQRFPVRVRQLLFFQASLRVFRERLGLSRTLGPFNFQAGPRRLGRGLAAALAAWDHARAGPDTPSGRATLHAAATLLFLQIFQEHPNPLREAWEGTRERERRDPRLQAVLRHLDVHLAQPLDLRELKREVGASPEWIRKEFRRQLHLSPKRYLQRLRIQRALDLLKNPRMTVEEVAHQVGYRSLPAFHRAFKLHAGSRPLDMRELHLTH